MRENSDPPDVPIGTKSKDNILNKSLASVVDLFKSDDENKQDKEDKEENELSEQDKADKLRINHQSYLMFNWETLTAQSKKDASRFTSFAQVDHPEPAELNNILFKRPPKFDILLSSKSADLSYFIPKVRIFKQHKISATEVVDIELPIAEGYKDEDFYNIYKNKAGRGGGVGLKSFNWNTIGNSPGNQFSFGAELELFFENISEISKIRSVDLIGQKNYETSFADLLILKKAPGQCSQGAIYDPDYYRIKAQIGWHIPKGDNIPVSKEMVREIEASNLSLYLGIHSHELNIADDSTVTLKIKYIAYIEALMDSPKNSNVFYPEDESYESSIESKTDTIKELSEGLQANKDTGAEAQTGLQKKQTEDKIKHIEEHVSKLQTSNKIEVYQRILNYIYNKSGCIRFTVVKPEVFKMFTDIISTKKHEMSSQEQVDSYYSEINKIREMNTKAGSGGSALLEVSALSAIATPAKPEDLITSVKSVIDQANQTLPGLASDGSVVIPYFYLGDLIEAIVSDMYNGGKAKAAFLDKQVKLLLGPLVFRDYGRLTNGNVVSKSPGVSLKGSGQQKTVIKTYSGVKSVVNIADIPISLDIYGTWFTKKIVDAGIVNMNLREFINSIINDLVIRSIGSEIYAFAPRQKIRLVYKVKTLRGKQDRLSGASSSVDTKPSSYGQAASNGTLAVPKTLRFNATSLKLYDDNLVVEEKSTIDNFVLIYATSDQAYELLSDYDDDIKKGIRHIVYGAETGLIKNIKFTRQDNPMIRSHNMRLASSEGGDRSVILREVYNANIEMYGNSLFEIGELIYVTPSLFGSADSIGFIKDLGIGGYFMILRINNSIEDGVFKTSLELRWNAKGDGIPDNINDGKQKPASGCS